MRQIARELNVARTTVRRVLGRLQEQRSGAAPTAATPPKPAARPSGLDKHEAFIRQLLERQAIRRMDADTLTPEQVEGVGLALMRLEETVEEMARRFGLDPKELNLDLGPLGRLI